MTLGRLCRVALLASSLASLGTQVACDRGEKAHPIERWRCPMHPTYVSDRPGDCPICGMKLVPVAAGPAQDTLGTEGAAGAASAPHAAPATREHAVYACPMHPEVRSDHPGTCPKCGMALRPLVPDGAVVEPVPPLDPRRVEVTIPPDRLQRMGVRTTTVSERTVDPTIRTVGRVDFDERRLHHVHVKVDGYIDHLDVDFTGRHVHPGDRLLTLYSPELVASQNDYLIALGAVRRAGPGADTAARTLESARKRLRFFDVGDRDLAALESSGEPLRAVSIFSRHAGIVLKKAAAEGMRVTPADSLFEIADLSRVWVLADVYERELPFVHLRQSAQVKVASVPDRTWEGMVTYIYPVVDDRTRTVKVRIELENGKGLLKPGMLTDVVLRSRGGAARRLAVPDTAVIHTGTRTLVFVARDGGRFEPRPVELGEHAGEVIEVRAGLEVGERIVVGANFLLDSESRLRAALDAMAPADSQPIAPEPTGHLHPGGR